MNKSRGGSTVVVRIKTLIGVMVIIALCLCSSSMVFAEGVNTSESQKEKTPVYIYSGNKGLIYLYSDGSISTKDFDSASDPLSSVAIASGGYFYIQQGYSKAVKKYDLTGHLTSTLNQSGNSFITASGDYTYYRSLKSKALVKTNEVTGASVVLGDYSFSSSQSYISGDQIWFTNQKDYAIYTSKGGVTTKLSGADCYLYHVDAKYIYYSHYENNHWAVYRMTLGGGGKTKLTGKNDASEVYFANNRVYYFDHNTKIVYSVNADGTSTKALTKLEKAKTGANFLTSSKDVLYVASEDQFNGKQIIYSIILSSGVKKELSGFSFDTIRGGAWARIENAVLLDKLIVFTLDDGLFKASAISATYNSLGTYPGISYNRTVSVIAYK